MLKKIILLLYLIGLILLFVLVVNYDMSSLKFYFLSLILLVLGLFLYPINKHLKEKSDFLIFPYVVVVLFNIINVITINNYSESISLTNITFSLFGFGQYFYKRMKNKTLYNKV